MATLWIKNRKDARDLPKLLAMAAAQRLPQADYSRIVQQRFKVVPNTSDDRGGYFVAIHASTGKPWWQVWR